MIIDLATYNPLILRNKLLRCSAVERHLLPQGCDVLELRTEAEITESGPVAMVGNTLWLPLDVSDNNTRATTKMEHNYVSWAQNGGLIFPRLFDKFDGIRPLAISCARGIDRTGFVSAAIHLLLGTDEANIIAEYLRAGDSETKPHHLRLALQWIKRSGNACNYFESICCQSDDVARFRRNILARLNDGCFCSTDSKNEQL